MLANDICLYIMGKLFTFRALLFLLLFSAVCMPASGRIVSIDRNDVSLYQQDKKQQHEKQKEKQLDESFQDRKPQEDQNKAAKEQGDKKKKDQKKSDNKADDNGEPDIKEVPKSKKQSRPALVSGANVKIKAIKITRPKIKKP